MKSVKGIFYALVSSSSFGLIPLFSIPLLGAGMDTYSILFYRMGFAAVIIGMLGALFGGTFKISFKDFLIILFLAFLYAVTSWGLLYSYNYIPSGVATTIHFIYPLCVTLIMILFFHERSSVWLIVAALLSLLGVALLSWEGSINRNMIRGVGSVLVTVVTYAVYIVTINRSRASRLKTPIITFYVLLISAVLFGLWGLTQQGIAPIRSWGVFKNAFLLALIPTVLSNITLVQAIKHIGSTMTSILGSMEPLTAIVVGVIRFGERFDLDSAVGVCLVLTSVIVVILQNRRLAPGNDQHGSIPRTGQAAPQPTSLPAGSDEEGGTHNGQQTIR